MKTRSLLRRTEAASQGIGKAKSAELILRNWCLLGAIIVSAFSLQPSAFAQDSLCARIKIEIVQQLTLERDAFEARMTINNGVVGVPIEGIDVTVNFADANRQSVGFTWKANDTSPTNLFFIRYQDGSGLPASIAGGTSATIKWLIIPAPGAAGTGVEGQYYYVGATLKYRAAGKDNEVAVEPDDILVKPMPMLTLDYFLPWDVYGDDPFTLSFVEPPIPFSLGVRVKNTGMGTARKLKIDSAQPRIVENTQGLLVDFKLHGCEVNGAPAQSTLLADFGDIQPNRAGVARWIMTSTLSGRFVAFNAYYTHADELGGQLTSLLSEVRTHTNLLHDVLVDLPGRDAVRDFLVGDGSLRLYESEGVDSSVADRSAGSSLVTDGAVHRVRTVPQVGFLYIRLTDPMSGRQLLRSAQRADGRLVHPANAWLSQTWDKAAKKWDYYVNLFDVGNPSGADYLLQYKDSAQRTNRPPRLDPISNWAIGPSDRVSFPITASDPDGDRLAFQLESPAPTGASITPEGVFSWQPGGVGVPSTNRLTVTVTDNGLPALSDSRGFTLIVRDTSANQPPVLALSTNYLMYSEGSSAAVLDPLATVTDQDTAVFDRGRLTVAVIEGRTESDALGLVEPSATQTNLTVTAENVVEYRSVPLGLLTLVNTETNVLTVDFNTNATVALVQEVLRGVTFRNTAVRGASPSRVIQFSVSDGQGGASTPVDLAMDIVPVNHPPVAVDDEAATTADMPIGLPIAKLVGNDSDADGDLLTFELLGSVTQQRGTVDIVNTNTVVYIPDPNLVGTDSFRYRITDPYGGWAEATVTVTVGTPASPGHGLVWMKPGPDGSMDVELLGIPSRTYTVEWSFDLLYWSFLMKATAGATGEIHFTDHTADPSRRFYRIVYP